MLLSEKESIAIRNLQTQEETCIKKYGKYEKEALDTELKNLFHTIQKAEKEHYNSLEQVLSGKVPNSNCNDSDGKNYCPTGNYNTSPNEDAKKHDNFLATDAIATEKLVSSEYNSGVFVFANSDVRKLLADIQIEEQNHAEMIYKYKEANSMC